MRGPHNLWRLIRTGATFERTGAMKVALDAADAPKSVRSAARILGWPFRVFGLKGDETQPPVLRAITALGPAYIKFGQLLSTRPDIVGDDLANELTVLQDSLPAFAMDDAIAIVEAELEMPIDEAFAEFHPPVAAASLAQVHPAVLASGDKVAVKILRPNIEKAFMKDVDAFHFGATMIDLLAPQARRLKPKDVVEHFEHIVRNELDLRLEASVGNEFAENTQNDPRFVVPDVIWTHSNRRVLTTTWAEGIALSDRKAIENAPVDHVELSNLIIQSFLRQALRDGLFHGDMHQGNLKLAPNGDLIALDFGIMGRIDRFTRRVYAEILYGFLKRDYKLVADVHFEAGYVPADQDRAEFAQAIRSIGEPIFGQDATKISMARLLGHLFEVTEAFGMQTRTELILLQRTMVVVEGVSRSINPGLNIWETAKPVVEEYIKANIGPKAMLEDMRAITMQLSRVTPDIPLMIDSWHKSKIRQEEAKSKAHPKLWLIASASGALGFLIAQFF